MIQFKIISTRKSLNIAPLKSDSNLQKTKNILVSTTCDKIHSKLANQNSQENTVETINVNEAINSFWISRVGCVGQFAWHSDVPKPTDIYACRPQNTRTPLSSSTGDIISIISAPVTSGKGSQPSSATLMDGGKITIGVQIGLLNNLEKRITAVCEGLSKIGEHLRSIRSSHTHIDGAFYELNFRKRSKRKRTFPEKCTGIQSTSRSAFSVAVLKSSTPDATSCF